MLGISDNTVQCQRDLQDLQAPKLNQLVRWHFMARRLLLALLVVFVILLFVPWQQNIQANGRVTTLRPEQRPQMVHATIPGRIEHWYVMEGQPVKKGDTIVRLSEVKVEYFDPNLVQRVSNQVRAKENAILSYQNKIAALEAQIAAMRRERDDKIQQILNKIRQAELKIEADSVAVLQAEVDIQIARRQFDGVKNLYDRGLKSLTEFEEKRAKLQESKAKLVAAENKLAASRNELNINRTELSLTRNEYDNKISKAESEKFSTQSEMHNAQAEANKLRIEQENYSRRAAFYYILAPQDGYVVQAITPGVGEIIKEGDPVVSILSAKPELAVEMYIRPMDVPLIKPGNQVRFLFDGWPAFFFSGWPNISVGTYAGRVVAIDRNISDNGRFRVLVKPDPDDEPWPEALQVGGGVRGIALLNIVPVWYELWRVLNGFPPDLYAWGKKSDEEQKEEGLLPNAPIKKVK
ncbi:MAG: HlyD family efflux transporter periplasmic adaptor subunit [Saprospiraceae bacterium]|nr:HlyD family secretion protein [Saprospiraceae bacterium]MDW8229088.1 HlyD family efflux transporter periplasmic adaptor subunit [Saprospiraceae bacterium]